MNPSDQQLFDIMAKGLKSPTTVATYLSRINSLNAMCHNAGIMYILLNPHSVYKKMLLKYPGPTATRGNFISAITKLFSSNTELAEQHKSKYVTWTEYLRKERADTVARYDTNKPTEKQMKNIVEYNDVLKVYQHLKQEMAIGHDNLHFMLFSILINLRPKRADLGNVIILKKDPGEKGAGRNYIVMGGGERPKLVVNKYKMVRKYGPIVEELNPVLVEDINLSLQQFPRKFLFVDTNGVPYDAGPYGVFVQRAFQKYLGKGCGVSLWRHIHITEKINPLVMNLGELKNEARLMGHSVAQQSIYMWKNMS
jgi:hypothetical protein